MTKTTMRRRRKRMTTIMIMMMMCGARPRGLRAVQTSPCLHKATDVDVFPKCNTAQPVQRNQARRRLERMQARTTKEDLFRQRERVDTHDYTETLDADKRKTVRRSPGAGIMEADDHQVTRVFTGQPSFHHRHSTNRVS